MTNAKIDGNSVPTILGVSMADGTTPLPVYANPSNHALKANLGGVGTVYATVNGPRDENSKVAFMAVSSVDGVTPVAVYIDPATNSLLISQ